MFGVKIIDCKNDSICVVLSFNNELCGKILSQIGLRAMVLGRKSKILTLYPKISLKGTFHQISI